MADQHLDAHDRGLAHDLARMLPRRSAMKLFAGAGAGVLLAGCRVPGRGPGTGTSTTTAGGSAGGGDCAPIPTETGGPFPGDGSNGPDVLAQSGVVRQDIRASFGSASAVAAGVPLLIRLKVLDTSRDCTPRAGAAVYVWHCDRDGQYSLYGSSIADQNYLRGVQEADADGTVTFQSIFPAAYPGRWPHVHFEVYDSVAAATGNGRARKTSQLALPEDVCHEVYATDGYGQSVPNLARTSLARDMVFADGVDHQLGAMSGDVGTGLVTSLDVPV
jgi:protocatechuate 3,4-dioxygenase beta subunit